MAKLPSRFKFYRTAKNSTEGYSSQPEIPDTRQIQDLKRSATSSRITVSSDIESTQNGSTVVPLQPLKLNKLQTPSQPVLSPNLALLGVDKSKDKSKHK